MAADGDEVAALTAVLDQHLKDAAAMANALVELDRHPGHQLFTATLSTGVTAERWSTAEVALAGLWRDFDTYRAVLTEAEAVRARRSRPGAEEAADLRRLLVEPSVAVARRAVPLHERGLTGAAEQVETITVTDLTTRMNKAYRQVSELAVRCDDLSSGALKALAPLLEQVRTLVVDADALGGVDGTTAVVERVRAVEHLAGSDPLVLADQPLDVTELTADLARQRAQVDRVLALREDWLQARAGLLASVHALAELRTATEHDYAAAAERVVGALPALPADRGPELSAAVQRLEDQASWADRETGTAQLHSDLSAADAELRAARELATGLLERREELRGRFGAYEARAVRLGRAEEPEVMAVAERVKSTLWRRPSDLAAATRDLGVLRRLLAEPGAPSGGDSG